MSIFSEIGPAYKHRAMHNLSHEVLQTQKIGQLVPGDIMEVLPGDTISFNTDMVVRISPLLAPIMSNIDVTTHYWFVPNRIIWEDWEEFITGGKDNDPTTAPVAPTIKIQNASVGSLADYLGVPTGVSQPLNVSALPFRAYASIYNSWYRDENLQGELGLSLASGVDTTTNTTLQNRNWNHDRFTSALPWPQRGPAVTIPVGSQSAPVRGDGKVLGISDGTNLGVIYRHASDGWLSGTSQSNTALGQSTDNTNTTYFGNNKGFGVTTDPTKSGLIADLVGSVVTPKPLLLPK